MEFVVSMRIVLFSDIHGNVSALERVLAHIRRETTPDMIIVAGDLVAFGPRPSETLALLRSLPDARFVVGNTDQYVLQEQDSASVFTRSTLTSDDLNWLESLPFAQCVEAAPGHELLVVHANPKNLYDAIKPEHSPLIIRPLLQDVTQEVVAFGHYHVPFIREVDGCTLVDVASVGMPRDGLLRAVYVTLTFEGGAWHISHHRIAFDAMAVARDYDVVGFPEAKKMARKLLDARY
jgi:putative phosphoesterase